MTLKPKPSLDTEAAIKAVDVAVLKLTRILARQMARADVSGSQSKDEDHEQDYRA